MSSGLKLKTAALIFAILYAGYLLIPTIIGLKEQRLAAKKEGRALPWYYDLLPDKELNLGLDLRGGLYMEMEVGIAEALTHQVDFLAGDIRRFVLEDHFKEAKVFQIPEHRLRVEIDADKQGAFTKELVRTFGNGVLEIKRGKFELFYEIKIDPLTARKAAFDALKTVPGYDGEISFSHGEKYLAVSFKNDEEREAIRAALSGDVVSAALVEVTNKLRDVVYLDLTDTYREQLKKTIIEQAAKSVRNRIDRFGVAEASVSRQSSDRLVVELPGVKDPDRIIDIIKRTGKLEFRLVDETIPPRQLQAMVDAKKRELGWDKVYDEAAVKELNKALAGELPPGMEVAFQLIRHPETKKVTDAVPYVVEKKAQVTGDMLDNASVQTQNNMPYVSMSFNKTGTKKFGELTSQNVGKKLAIMLDGVITSNPPVIKTAILGGRAQIELGFGRYDQLQREAQEIVLVLKEGALPASLTVGTKNLIGPSLGKESIRAGMNSLLIGAAVVLAFMLVYYKVGGVVANIALLVNVLLIFGILTLFQASLTLPGIAGIVLTTGMAVDANVIIFERMREEMALGQKVGVVVENGYGNAMSAIIDSNVTTFISGLVLFEFGTGPIKGFATTLMIGIATTLITAVVLTRIAYDWMLGPFKVKKIRI